jgi:hypothetical protein
MKDAHQKSNQTIINLNERRTSFNDDTADIANEKKKVAF